MKVDRSMTPWLIATWHAPWYSTYKAHYREAECMRIEMEELLYSYGVDIIFNGHVSKLNNFHGRTQSNIQMMFSCKMILGSCVRKIEPDV